MPGLINAVATPLLTYAVHSFVACAVAIFASRLLRRPQDRDLLWKAAFIAPVFTATATVLLSAFGDHGTFVDLANVLRHALPVRFPGREVTVRVFFDATGENVDRQFIDPVTTTLSMIAVALALCVVSVAALRFAHRRRVLGRALAGRCRIGDLHDDSCKAPITLSVAAELQSPVAFGRAEICLPTEVLDGFAAAHRRSLIAHEVAHLERRDPAWLLAVELIAALSAFQPLVFVVARAFRRDVELICDEAAVRRTNDRPSMIAALARLASPFDSRSPLYGAATAYDGSPLVARATRIAALPMDSMQRGVRRGARLAVMALIVLLCAVPVVSAAPRASDFPLDPHDAVRKARAEGRVVTVDTNVTVLDAKSEVRRRTIVRVQ